jgi:16S rRNA (adenine(1408)-N(1))-methyltransferase
MIPSARRCQRAGLRNALFVCACAEDPPEPLHGLADEVFVHLPWGSLLSGVVHGASYMMSGIRRMAQPGATLRIVVGADIWRLPIPKEIRDLPELTADYVDTRLAARFADHGWKITNFGPVDPAEVPSTWARRLSANRAEPTFVALHAVAV